VRTVPSLPLHPLRDDSGDWLRGVAGVLDDGASPSISLPPSCGSSIKIGSSDTMLRRISAKSFMRLRNSGSESGLVENRAFS
jgi:hypothetical protein